ncbi:hypothetical protein LRS10_22515 [Phenylobacterium sp. J426]|uniref:hypothetical protein n=1 Tax=Phenylobacterium sp. J426 TaxID=2898439 RepID=UPI002151640D|nr:hypothetical protein [Phenylobacterium sp. J426]MCR5876683.1 hypothetical protein [Phenylobacterium sp. J426]
MLLALDDQHPAAQAPEIMSIVTSVDPNLSVVALGDSRNAQDVLSTMRAGVADFLEREDAVDALREHLERRLASAAEIQRGEPGAFSVVLNAQPGGGAGLFALNLAIVRGRKHHESLLVDCHLPASEAGAALDLTPTYTMADAVRDAGRLDRTLLLSALAQHPGSGLRLLPLALRATDDTSLSPEAFLQALRAIRPLFRETVLYAGGIRHPLLLGAVVSWASSVFLVSPQKYTALRDAKDLLLSLPHDFDVRRRVTLVVDEYSPMINVSPEQMQATLGLERVVRLPAARDELINGLNLGRAMVLEHPNSAYAAAIQGAASGEAGGAEPKLGEAVRRVAQRILKRPG